MAGEMERVAQARSGISPNGNNTEVSNQKPKSGHKDTFEDFEKMEQERFLQHLKIEKEKKARQNEIKKVNQLKRLDKLRENVKNSTWGDDFDVLDIDSIDEKAEKELQKLDNSHTIPFQKGALSSVFGSGEPSENLSEEQKASFENGNIAGYIVQGATGGYVIKTLGVGAGLAYTGTLGVTKELGTQAEKGKKLDIPKAIGEGSKAVTASLLPMANMKNIKAATKLFPGQFQGKAQWILENGSEASIKTLYDTAQQYKKDPKSVNWETVFGNLNKNAAEKLGEGIFQGKNN